MEILYISIQSVKKTSIKWTFFLILLLFYKISNSQTYQLEQDKIISNKEKLLQHVEKRLKSDRSISFSLSNEIIPLKILQKKDNKFLKRLLKTIKKYPDSVEPFIKLGIYHREIKEKEVSKQYYEKSLELLQIKKTIKDSVGHYIRLAAIKKELGQDFYPDLMFVMENIRNDSVTVDHKYTPFIFLSLLGNGKYEVAQQKAIQLLDDRIEYPEPIYLALILAFVFEKSLELGQNEFLIFDKYLKLYEDNSTIQNIRMLANLYPLYLKIPSFHDYSTSEIILAYTAKELKELDRIKNYLEESLRKKNINIYTFHKYLGYVSFFKDDRQSAINHFEKAIKKLSNDQKNIRSLEDIYDMLYALYSLEKEYTNIRKITERRIQLIKEDDKLLAIEYHKLAWMYFEKNNFEKALDWCIKAKNKDDKNSDVFSLLAHLEFKKGKLTTELSYYLGKALENADTKDKAFAVCLQYGIYNMLFGDATMASGALTEAYSYNSNANEIETLSELFMRYFKVTD